MAHSDRWYSSDARESCRWWLSLAIDNLQYGDYRSAADDYRRALIRRMWVHSWMGTREPEFVRWAEDWLA